MTEKLTTGMLTFEHDRKYNKYPQRRTLKGEYDQKLSVRSFGHAFVGVNFFRSNSNQFLVFLIRSSELASSFGERKKLTFSQTV